jgi:uncharacterized membrane protein HdeD (DUF308 family)
MKQLFIKREEWTRVLISLILCTSGVVILAIPEVLFTVVLEVLILYLFLNAVYLIFQAFKHHKRSDLVYGVLSMFFSILLSRYPIMPEWIIRVIFGIYCLCSATANFIQGFLDYLNGVKGKKRMFVFGTAYFIIGMCLLFIQDFPSELLFNYFGVYFILLGIRYLLDAIDGLAPEGKYKWHRRIRITLPPLVSAFLPDWVLNQFNHYLQKEDLQPALYKEQKSEENPDLKIMVFSGPVGLQKVGHCCFAYKGIVYSYGNYDAGKSGLEKVIGDGCYFNVPIDVYQQSMLEMENNSIFEYGIHTSEAQNKAIEEQLEALRLKSFRWYCQIEKEDGYAHHEKYAQDYPCRLHYRTGAKFYKIKSGKFRYYWFLGDNCASFMDEILGTLGADILSMRGFITPGTYYDFLENEYAKKNSPVIYKSVHPWIAKNEDTKKSA